MSDADAEARLLEAILAHGADGGDRLALVCEGGSLSWGGLRARVLRLAGAIVRAAPEADRPICLLGANSLDLVVAYLAIIAAGRCAVPLPVSATSETLADMLADCDPALVFLDSDGLALARGYTGGPFIGLGVEGEDVIGLEAFMGEGPALAAPDTVLPGTPFNIIYSSGTTARPKGIVHAHAMRYRQAARGVFALSPASTMLLATPFYSNTTLMPLLATLFHGGRVVLMRKFSASAYLDRAEHHGATHTMLVPVQYQRILDEPGFSNRDLSRFEIKQCTGAPLPATLKHKVVAHWPGRLLEIYGLTEGGCTAILDVVAHPDKAHSVGRPAPGNDIRIIDDAGTLLAPGEVGELVGRSPAMMSGYFRDSEATKAFYWHAPDGTVFHRTGDIGRFDADGFLVLLDRKKDVIISGGFNIYASDLEGVLMAHEAVSDATVIGVPSERWGETPLGLVVLREGAAVTGEALLDHVNARVGKLQRLSGIELRDSLPRSPAGKLLKQTLKAHYRGNA